ncbi:MAG: hypothetical protein ACREUU_17080, partial [Gammaproteobacteria bacterium]
MNEALAVELVYRRGCPNIEAARVHLLRAFAGLGMTPQWREWDADDPATPPHARGRGSPTILIDGRDVDAMGFPDPGPSCRVYPGADGAVARVPSLDQIVTAMRPDENRRNSSIGTGVKLGFATAPGIGLALAPKLVCPLCWPLYTSLLGSAGLSFVNYTPYLYPLTLVFLSAAVSAIGIYSPRGGRTFPLLLGAGAAFAILAGKFHLLNGLLVY